MEDLANFSEEELKRWLIEKNMPDEVVESFESKKMLICESMRPRAKYC